MKPPSLPSRLINRLSSHFPAKDERFLQVPEESRVGLDPHQRAAAFATSSRTIIQAGAGSGKTAVLTRRVAHLLQSGVPLNRIRIITFTRHATRELVERLHKLTGRSPKELEESVSTIHKLAIRALSLAAPKLRFVMANLTIPHDPARRAWDDCVRSEVERVPELADLLAELVKWKNSVVDVYALHSKQNVHPEPHIPAGSGVNVRSEMERKVADYLTRTGLRFKYESCAYPKFGRCVMGASKLRQNARHDLNDAHDEPLGPPFRLTEVGITPGSTPL
ncbi:UvrD-helicase domain-containing protein [Corallococcus exiguus]|uniref:UvrD-helicase domain-containing protein n=1 Tax=Corallococcus exiguus TaxID=83462 RepID=UPI001A8DA2F6|nr:UvrD-helicase domain-containing protein [Corallococcus exiguus]